MLIIKLARQISGSTGYCRKPVFARNSSARNQGNHRAVWASLPFFGLHPHAVSVLHTLQFLVHPVDSPWLKGFVSASRLTASRRFRRSSSSDRWIANHPPTLDAVLFPLIVIRRDKHAPPPRE